MGLVAADAITIADAARLLRQGELVAFPTETVYGLGADATNAQAVARIFEAKGRPRFNPLISHVADIDAARRLGQFDAAALALATAFWPGPLTLVVPRAQGCPVAELATAGLATVAIRVPAHPIAQALLEAAGIPIAAPSANRSGRVSPTEAGHVADDLGARVACILDGGPTQHGLESTVLAVTSDGVVMLRPGAVTAEAIEAVAGQTLLRATEGGERPQSPGQLESHYAPAASVRLDVIEPRPGEALLAFGPNVPAYDRPVFNLSPSGDLVEAAARLFAGLRALDASGAAEIAVMPIPRQGLGEAINDRLSRAAAPRPTAWTTLS